MSRSPWGVFEDATREGFRAYFHPLVWATRKTRRLLGNFWQFVRGIPVPPHTFESVGERLIRGLEDGSLVLGHEGEEMAKAKMPSNDEMESLARDIKSMKDRLAALPEDTEFTQEQLGILDDLRTEAVRLKFEVEVIFDVVNGK